MAQRNSEVLSETKEPIVPNNENNQSSGPNNRLKQEGRRNGKGFQPYPYQRREGQRGNRWTPKKTGGQNNPAVPQNEGEFTSGKFRAGMKESFTGPRNPEERFMERLRSIGGPTYDLPPLDMSEKKFSGKNRLYVSNLSPDTTEAELEELFKPFGEINEPFINKDKNFAFIKLDYQASAAKAKRELDGKLFKNNIIKIRFSPNGFAIKVKNLTPWVTNELLFTAFSIFGEIDRCIVIADDRGKSTGEGIIEYMRKTSAMAALKRCNESCFFLTSSFRPVVAESYDQLDLYDGFSERNIFKKNQDYYEAREIGPRFAAIGSFEHEFGTQWKQLHHLYNKKSLALKQELEIEQDKLEAQMQFAKFESETEMLREQLRAREQDRDRQKREWEERERILEEQRRRNENHIILQEDNLRSQSQNSLFLQAQQLNNMLNEQEQAYNIQQRGSNYNINEPDQQPPMDPKNFINDFERNRNINEGSISTNNSAKLQWNVDRNNRPNAFHRKRRHY